MKKRILFLLFALTLLLALSAPALAAPAGASYIRDYADILTDDEEQSLNALAASYAEANGCGIYVATVYDYEDYSTYSVMDAAAELYKSEGFAQDGVLVMLSMRERDYALICHGYGSDAITDKGKTLIENDMLPYFGDDDWQAGFASYINKAGALLESAASGQIVTETPLDKLKDNLLLILLAPLVITLIVVLLARAQMKSVAPATTAREYVTPGSFHLNEQSDRFTHTTQTRVKIKEESSGSGGGFSSSNSSFSGHSGKF